MSVSKLPFPVKERNTKVQRYDIPRFTHDEQGYLVLDDLHTADLPQGPPEDAGHARKRFVAVVCGVALLAGAVAFLAGVIVADPSAFFGRPGGEMNRWCSNTTSLGKANASSNQAIYADSSLLEDDNAIGLLTSSEAIDIPATGPRVFEHTLE
ncbi:uncharacterized protein [Dermacentor albipictus]|uniref:uncharacterized protein n=1 Tax=Dermacentor albipictus TaxID=60249 RepID=UPI0031FC2C1F